MARPAQRFSCQTIEGASKFWNHIWSFCRVRVKTVLQLSFSH